MLSLTGGQRRAFLGTAMMLTMAAPAFADGGAYSAPVVEAPVVEAPGDAPPFIAVDEEDEEFEFLLTQSQPPVPLEAQPEEAVRPPASVRRRRRTYQLPPMFGDTFGGSSVQFVLVGPQAGIPAARQTLGTIPVGGGVGREKIAENNSPEPRARILWNYNHYDNVVGGIGDVSRNSFGIEHPFGNGTFSAEVRFPFAGTLDVDQVIGATSSRSTQFGDITAILKALLWENDDFLVSMGLGVTAPTADASQLFALDGTQLTPVLNLRHESVHLLPFLAAMHGYDSGWYWQSFLQLDFPTNGDSLDFGPPAARREAGVLQEQTVFFADLGVGRWLMGGPGQPAPAVAATAELHYATPLQDADLIAVDNFEIASAINRYDTLNLTLGLNIVVTDRFSIRPAAVVPLHDDQFDSEAMIQANFWR